jgi:hypothetical protein
VSVARTSVNKSIVLLTGAFDGATGVGVEGGMFKNCSSSLVSHIHGSCESGPENVGVNNVHHEPVTDKHNVANIYVRHDGCVNNDPKLGFNLALLGY